VRIPKSRNEIARLREQSQKPAEIKSVGPIGNRLLIASQKPERPADAMDRWSIGQPLSQEMAKLFLRSPADADDDVLRLVMFDLRE
jgi:hypothetical protein